MPIFLTAIMPFVIFHFGRSRFCAVFLVSSNVVMVKKKNPIQFLRLNRMKIVEEKSDIFWGSPAQSTTSSDWCRRLFLTYTHSLTHRTEVVGVSEWVSEWSPYIPTVYPSRKTTLPQLSLHPTFVAFSTPEARKTKSKKSPPQIRQEL